MISQYICICMCVCIYIYIYIYIYTHTHAYAYISCIYIHILYIYMCICIYIYYNFICQLHLNNAGKNKNKCTAIPWSPSHTLFITHKAYSSWSQKLASLIKRRQVKRCIISDALHVLRSMLFTHPLDHLRSLQEEAV